MRIFILRMDIRRPQTMFRMPIYHLSPLWGRSLRKKTNKKSPPLYHITPAWSIRNGRLNGYRLVQEMQWEIMVSHARDLVRATSIKAGYQAAPPQEYPLQLSAINFQVSQVLQVSQVPPSLSSSSQVPKFLQGLKVSAVVQRWRPYK